MLGKLLSGLGETEEVLEGGMTGKAELWLLPPRGQERAAARRRGSQKNKHREPRSVVFCKRKQAEAERSSL